MVVPSPIVALMCLCFVFRQVETSKEVTEKAEKVMVHDETKCLCLRTVCFCCGGDCAGDTKCCTCCCADYLSDGAKTKFKTSGAHAERIVRICFSPFYVCWHIYDCLGGT